MCGMMRIEKRAVRPGKKGERGMRRKDREIQNVEGVFDVVERCQSVHLGMVDKGKPYVVALNFGCDRQGDDMVLYLHSAQEGRKIDVLKENPEVCFQMDCVNEFIVGTDENPCAYCWRYDSVMGSGKAYFITDGEERKHALNRIIQHYAKTDKTFVFPPQMLDKTCTIKIVSSEYSGKHRE